MEYFLTSSPFLGRGEGLNPGNHFLDLICPALGEKAVSALFVASDPENTAAIEVFGNDVKVAFEKAGVRFSSFIILDKRREEQAPLLVGQSTFLILAGGHVPTQNAFFQKIQLRELLSGFSGVILGISAGSMNAADVVYAQPELPGEGIDENYVRFLPGLGITTRMILPHYGETKDALLDGMRLFEDITYPDSFGREFFIFHDGAFLHGKDGEERVYGHSYVLKDGKLFDCCQDGESRLLSGE